MGKDYSIVWSGTKYEVVHNNLVVIAFVADNLLRWEDRWDPEKWFRSRVIQTKVLMIHNLSYSEAQEMIQEKLQSGEWPAVLP